MTRCTSLYVIEVASCYTPPWYIAVVAVAAPGARMALIERIRRWGNAPARIGQRKLFRAGDPAVRGRSELVRYIDIFHGLAVAAFPCMITCSSPTPTYVVLQSEIVKPKYCSCVHYYCRFCRPRFNQQGPPYGLRKQGDGGGSLS